MGLFGKKIKPEVEPAEKKSFGSFVGFVLLSEAIWDKEKLLTDLKEDWNIVPDDDREDTEENNDSLVFSVGDIMAAVSLMPAPVPNQEAEENAANNYMWPDAVEVARQHQAHLMVAVLGQEKDILEKGKLYVKVLATCCKQKCVTGVYTSGVVFEPESYRECAEMAKEDQLPIFNWIWFGLYGKEGHMNCYTYGMEVFGKDEMEVLDADAKPRDVRDFLCDMVSYVLCSDVILKNGETIGFSAEDKHAITRSEGVSLPGMTLKISY